MFGSYMNTTEVHEAEYSTFGTVENYIGLNGNNNDQSVAELTSIYPDADGHIRFTVTPGATSADIYKISYINAMAIMIPGIVKVIPFEPVAEGPWDGISMIEPARDVSGNCVIYTGAELAWVANQVNQGHAITGIKIAKDIDLGNQPWTPIGYGTYFTGKIDGQGYHIYNMYINKSDLTEKSNFAGFIGGTNSESCDIININLSGKIDIPASVAQKTQVGSFVGKANALGNMINCHSDVEINIMGAPAYVGGVLAFMKNANIKNCSYSGNITIATSGKVTNGIGGILGCTNSSTTGIEAVINGCYFDGSIKNNGSEIPKYVAGINSYSNLSKAAETITNNYVIGTIDCTATDQGSVYGKTNTTNFDCENNYYYADYTLTGKGGIPMKIEEFHSGEVAYLLNGDQMEFLFGQELDSDDNMPVVYRGSNRVYKTIFMYNDNEYAVLYNNTEMKFPKNPVPDDSPTFEGWYDEKGNRYDGNSTTQTDHMFDLTSLQVECNRKFAYSADETLKIIQSLYEKKVATYPRVDTTYLSDDIYPKCPGILKGLRDYETFTAPLTGTALLKSKKVFDNSKVTDHHAIIPTGQHPQNLTDMERRVFDLIARRFIAVFYPDCKFATTTVLGEVESIEFKATGKQILEPGWRIIFGTPSAQSQEEKEEKGEEENVLPAFVKGESGPHVPDLYEKWTQPPRPYTEATLLRAMETAGKLVDNDELRDALKENGIGRPSTRAAIIETLFKRNYIRKEKKNLIATPTGVELIQIIHEELLKSAELTGIWEKKLREIERRTYNAGQFLEELKQMVSEVVMSVLSDNSNRHITIQAPAPEKGSKASAKTEAADKPKKEPKKRTPRKSVAAGKKTEQASGAVAASSTEASVQADDFVGQPCPLCGKGTVIKGKTAYGCSEWKSGCTFRKPFE